MKRFEGLPNPVPALLYARVSSKDQEKEGFSVPAQLDLLRSYALTKGYVILQEFIDIETAKRTGRTGFGEMIALMRRSKPRPILLVEKTDRLYRNLKDWITVDDLGLEVHFIKENVVLSPESRSSEKFMHGIKVLMAKNYIDNLSEEVRKGMLAKAQQGIWPSFAPLGYLNVASRDGKRTIEPDPDLAPIIRSMFERYATGNYSLKEIGKLARAEGLAYRKSGASVPTSTVHKILRNRIYSGHFDFGGVTYPGVHGPIVSPELWEEVASQLDGRQKSKTRTKRFAFSGLIKCGHCGCALVGDIKKGRYVYYHCTGYKQKCPEPYTREELLEREFTKIIRVIGFTEEQLEWASRILSGMRRADAEAEETVRTRLRKQLAVLAGRMEAIYVDKLDGKIAPDFYERKAEEWRAEEEGLRARLQIAEHHVPEHPGDLRRLLRTALERFAEQPPTEKRKLLDCVLAGCTWAGAELTPRWRVPFSAR